ncbi:MAG: purine-nucleoside phosphorylase [Bacteroidetes bacterium]|nr:purine-nucleoside phosphorylase [Bacteroidota bacterium]
MSSYSTLSNIQQTAQFIQSKINVAPEFGIILGTGLGGLVNEMKIAHSFSYEDLPNFPVSTVESHSGKLIFGTLSGKNVVAMQGRFHFYEGYSMEEIVFPVRVMKLLGIKKLFVSNACGGLNPAFEKGDLFIINDHINLFPGNPLIGKNIDELGPRFPDMSSPYDRIMISNANTVAHGAGILTRNGVYAGLTGPMLESPAEYNYLRIIGADVVGMSTIPEIIAARHMGLPCFACSIITDICYGEIEPVSLEEIIAIAAKAEPKLTRVIKDLIDLQ